MELHEKISKVREAKKISRAEMATALNMSSQSYWNVETGKTELTVSRLTQIAALLEVSITELLTDEVAVGSEKEKTLERRIIELEQSLQEVRELKDYHLKSIESKNIALSLIDETINMYYQIIQDVVLEEPEMPRKLAVIAYAQLNDLAKIVRLIIDAKDLKTMEESIRKFIQDDSYDWLKFLSIFDRKERKGGASYWDGKYMVSETNRPNTE